MEQDVEIKPNDNLRPDPLPLPGAAARRARQRGRRWTALTLVAFLSIAGLLLLLRLGPTNGRADDPEPSAQPPQPFKHPAPFKDWAKPLVAIMLSGEQHGYMQPCGCSEPQYGGFARRFNFMQTVLKRDWPLVALDLGDIAQFKPNPLLELKYEYSMKALNLLNYKGIGVGEAELSMPLDKAIAQFHLNNPMPKLLAATLLDPKTNAFIRQEVDASEVINLNKPGLLHKNAIPQIGVVGLIGRSVAEKFAKSTLVKFRDNGDVVKEQLAKLKQSGSQLTVVLYQGNEKEAEKLSVFCDTICKQNRALARPDIILYLAPDEEPPGAPAFAVDAKNQQIPTMLINVGQKGRYVGVVGVFPPAGKNQPYQFKYQLVRIGPEFESPVGKEKENPILAMMDEYARAVMNQNLIVKFPTSPHEMQQAFPNARYVGSERCAGCHASAYKVWSTPPPLDPNRDPKKKPLYHANAFQTLVVDAKRPALRQHDGECAKCHVTGFDHNTGYVDALRANDQKRAKMLEGVGCESCHGPGSDHVKNPQNQKIRDIMNPWRLVPQAQRMSKINMFCQKCHDIDNDVHWDFSKNWPKVAHPSPKKNPVGQQPADPAVAPPANPPVGAPPVVAPPLATPGAPTALPQASGGLPGVPPKQ